MANGVKFNIQIRGLAKLSTKFSQAPIKTYYELDKAVKRAALVAVDAIKDETPIGKTRGGTLKRGIRAEFGDLTATISPHNAPYAIFVHEGTSPHIIRPKNKKALFWKGAKHPVRLVRHPGTRANPFFENGLESARTDIEDIFAKSVEDILKFIAS